MDPYSSTYIISNNSLHNPFPHSLLRTRQLWNYSGSWLGCQGRSCFKPRGRKSNHCSRRFAIWLLNCLAHVQNSSQHIGARGSVRCESSEVARAYFETKLRQSMEVLHLPCLSATSTLNVVVVPGNPGIMCL